MPRRRMPASRRKLKSGKSMGTKTSGRRSRATARSCRSMPNERGTTRSASTSPVTEKSVKSPTSSAPAARRRGPPKPKICVSGARRSSSVASAPAYRSPEASPHDSMMRKLRGSVEQAIRDDVVERDLGDRALDDRLAVLQQLRFKRDADAADGAVIGKHFFVEDRATDRTGCRIGLADDQHRVVDEEADAIELRPADLQHF